MGETNVAWNRKLHISRESLLAASAIYTGIYILKTPFTEISWEKKLKVLFLPSY